MHVHLTRKRIATMMLDTVLVGAFALAIGSFQIQPASAQVDRKEFRETARELNISRSQMRDVAAIKRSFDAEIEDILTPEQFETLQAARKQQQSQTQSPQQLQATLDLTEGQSEQLAEAREDMVEELEAVLEPYQLEGLMEKTAFSQI